MKNTCLATRHAAYALVLSLTLVSAANARAQEAVHTGRNAASIQPSAYLRPCSSNSEEIKSWCALNAAAFTTEFLKATAGDYQAQKNVAFLFSATMHPDEVNPVERNPVQACAWRYVIVRSGHAQVSADDTRKFDADCLRAGVLMTAVTARGEVLLRETKATRGRSTTPPQMGWIALQPSRSDRTATGKERLTLTQPQSGAAVATAPPWPTLTP